MAVGYNVIGQRRPFLSITGQNNLQGGPKSKLLPNDQKSY